MQPSRTTLPLFAYLIFALTLFGTGEDIFILLSFLDQILLADFFQKVPNFLEVKIDINRGAQLIESYLSCPLVALKMSIFCAFQRHVRQG